MTRVRPAVALVALLAATLDSGLTVSAGQADKSARPAAAPAVSRTTPHLTFTATLSPGVIIAGQRMSIAVDVIPKKGMHVYAPGGDYHAVAITLARNSLLHVYDPVYPKPTLFTFKPLNEQALVYDAPFRLSVDITPGDTPAQRAALREKSQLVIKGQLDYQACDDTVCYLPKSVPFQWTAKVAR